MNILDIVILILLIPALIRGISKGLIEQVAAFASLMLSAWAAYKFSSKLAEVLSNHISVSPQVLYIISFVIIIVVVVILLNIIAKLATKFMELLHMGWINSVLGFVFAVFNASLVIGLILLFFNSLNASSFHLNTTWMDESVIYQNFIKPITEALFPYLENFFSTISSGNETGTMC